LAIATEVAIKTPSDGMVEELDWLTVTLPSMCCVDTQSIESATWNVWVSPSAASKKTFV
jgi:hypothetical protein